MSQARQSELGTLTTSPCPTVECFWILSSSSNPYSSSSSPGNRNPLVNPGGMVLIPFPPSTISSPNSSGILEPASSNPPGQNGTFPAFPRTKFLLGPGARSSEVDVRPVDNRGLEVWNEC